MKPDTEIEAKKPDTTIAEKGRRPSFCSGAFPAMSEYEERVFAIFARKYNPGYHPHSIQLEGDKRLPVIAAGHRLLRKGILSRPDSCRWYLTDLGRKMAVEWQRQND